MSKHTEYKLVSAETQTDITELVNYFIDKGWQCQGSLVLQFPPINGKGFFQAMVLPKIKHKYNPSGPR